VTSGPRIAVLDDYQGYAAAAPEWGELGATEFLSEHHTGDDLVDRIAEAEVVVTMRERVPFDDDLLARLPRLRLLVTTGMHNAAIDLDAARRRGVLVCGTRGTDTPAAEMTWALIHAVTRQVPQADADLRAGRWQQDVGTDLAGARLGLLGLGRLGRQVARVGLAFGMEAVAWSQNLSADAAAEVGVTRVERDQLFATSDVLSLHVRLSARTHGIVGAAELALMKPSAVLVNTSRGPLVDETALVEALRAGRLAGAGLDVFDIEPLPARHPLLDLDGVVLTPHLGYVTRGSYEVFYGDARDDVAAWLAGSPVRVLT